MIAKGSIHHMMLQELVQCYGGATVREAISGIIMRGEVSDPAADRHSSAIRRKSQTIDISKSVADQFIEYLDRNHGVEI